MTLWTPSNLTDGSLDLWFDANNAGSLSLAGSTVNSWTDLANSVVVSAVGTAITYTASLLNGLPGLTFSSSNNALTAASTTHGSFASTISCFAVITWTSTNYQIVFAGYKGTANNNPAFGFDNSSPAPIAVINSGSGTSDSSTTLASNTPTIAEWVSPALTGGSLGPVVPYLTGNVAGTISALGGFSASQTGFSIGDSLNSNSFIGHVHEVVVLKTQASTTDRQLIEGYLAWKWGLQAGLPGGHPYASAAPTVAPVAPPGGGQVAVPGQVLTGNVGLWVNFPTGYAYQLLRNGQVFQSGPWGSGPTYTVQLSDVGDVISMMVTASNSSGSGPVANSAGVLIVS